MDTKASACLIIEEEDIFSINSENNIGFANQDLVIEAVFEKLSLKQSILADVEALAQQVETIFATNTSSLKGIN